MNIMIRSKVLLFIHRRLPDRRWTMLKMDLTVQPLGIQSLLQKMKNAMFATEQACKKLGGQLRSADYSCEKTTQKVTKFMNRNFKKERIKGFYGLLFF